MYDSETSAAGDESLPPIRQLGKAQRRVLGVLIEKAYTVPESYPLTLKSAISGCNQKSNRAPVTNYTEDAVLQALDELRELGLVAVVHTESGRTERYRHYARKRFPFSEPQLAILTELLLRGHQQMGELRSRVSRMVPIESLTDLRTELDSLMEQGYVQANGPLERRGVEVDHAFYGPQESPAFSPSSSPSSAVHEAGRSGGTGGGGTRPQASASTAVASRAGEEIAELKRENQELREELAELRQSLEDVKDSLTELRQSLGA